MRTKLHFEVIGSTHDDLVRRANQVVADYLGIEDLDEAMSKVEIEIDATSKVLPDSGLTFVANVSVRVK